MTFRDRLRSIFSIKPVYAHCDLPCGVYDPAQARIEAESVLKIQDKYEGLHDEDRMRAIIIKEHRADLVKQHLWVLWTDYFKPEHLEAHPNLHDLVWRATKQAGACKRSTDPAEGKKLLELIDEIAEVFQATKTA
jgi:nickel superoxide dismutase